MLKVYSIKSKNMDPSTLGKNRIFTIYAAKYLRGATNSSPYIYQ